MILRLLSLLVVSAPVIFVTLWFSGNPGQVVLDWLGWRVETNVPIFLVMLLVVFVVLFVVEQCVASLAALPVRLRSSRRAKGMEKGLTALIECLDAAATGYIETGRRLGAEAVRHLHRPDLAERLDRLMPRPASSPEPAAATSSVKSPGRKRNWWGRLFAIKPRLMPLPPRGRPMTPPVTAPSVSSAMSASVASPPPAPLPVSALDEAALIAAIQAGEWESALSLVGESYPTWRNLVLLGQAVTLAATVPQQARDLVGQVIADDPAQLAGIQLALRLDVAAGNRSAAETVLLGIWPHSPSFRLMTLSAPLWSDADADTRAAFVTALAKTNPDHAASHLILGEQAVFARQWGAARLHLVAAVKAAPSAVAYRLMALVEEQDGGDAAAIDMWKRLEGNAPAAETWHCQACGGVTEDWGLVCPQCAAVGKLSWR